MTSRASRTLKIIQKSSLFVTIKKVRQKEKYVVSEEYAVSMTHVTKICFAALLSFI